MIEKLHLCMNNKVIYISFSNIFQFKFYIFMQKKKSDNKINLPSVTVAKTNENSKTYTAKANLIKCR